MHSWTELRTQKILKDQNLTAPSEVLGAKQGTVYTPAHSTAKGVGRPPKLPLHPTQTH